MVNEILMKKENLTTLFKRIMSILIINILKSYVKICVHLVDRKHKKQYVKTHHLGLTGKHFGY